MKKSLSKVDAVLCILLVTCVALAVALATAKPIFLIPVLIILLIVTGIIFLFLRSARRMLAKLLSSPDYADEKVPHSLAALNLPVLVLSGDHILWYNRAFREQIFIGEDKALLPLSSVFPALDKPTMMQPQGQSFDYYGQTYTVYGGGEDKTGGLFVAYFVNQTQLTEQADEYQATRPSVMLISVDTYDEVLKVMKDSERARLLAAIDEVLEQFVGATTGLLRRISASRYLVVVEERHIQQILKNRFSVLDTVRGIDPENGSVTLSIGVGHAGETLYECEKMAEQALDMALGRGGDQVAVKSKDGFSFYGGVSHGVEKRSKVRSRIIASALCDLIRQSEQVIVTGHRMSDLDSVGASAGIWRLCRICGKEASIMLDERQTLAGNLVEQLRASGVSFIRPENAENIVNKNTLLIIVDTHLSHLLESQLVYQTAGHVVVIDHHRRCVGYIENAVVFHHEPAASSASELVTELLQYSEASKELRLTQIEAQALLAGIMLDTRDFAIHTGVRTFEAAAYLRRVGAQTTAVKKLFSASFESYAYKAHLVTEAEIFMGCAIVAAEFLPPKFGIVVPQAANDLLSIEGVDASFVAVDAGGQINVSARSMGDVNVQVIMEKLGGGGHLTMAGAQMKDTTLEDARKKLMRVIEEYRSQSTNKK